MLRFFCGTFFLDLNEQALSLPFFHLCIFFFLDRPLRSKRPSTSVEAIITYDTNNKDESWIPLTIHKGMWILMQQSKRIKSSTTNPYLAGWKGIIRDFRFGDNRKTVKEVLVQHVYMHKELFFDTESSILPLYRPNCKLLCTC